MSVLTLSKAPKRMNPEELNEYGICIMLDGQNLISQAASALSRTLRL